MCPMVDDFGVSCEELGACDATMKSWQKGGVEDVQWRVAIVLI